MIAIIDCYDSFVYNIADYVSIFTKVKVLSKERASDVLKMNPDGIIISPGPGKPDKSLGFLFKLDVPILGICLGHQMIAEIFCGKVEKVKPVHGKVSLVKHDGEGIFKGVRNPFRAARYHSLAITKVPEGFKVTAVSEDGIIMGIRKDRIEGVQFHPESILTEDGLKMIRNFVNMCYDR